MKTLLPVLAGFLSVLAHAGELLPPEKGSDISIEPPPATDGSIAIEFAPPPTEGTISLGLYDAAGKLVRVLRREATTADFEVGLNGLIARWDGRDDAGETVPEGTYRACGMTVGDLVVEGEAYLGNDWVGGDGQPRLKKIVAIAAEDGALSLLAEGSGSVVSAKVNAAGEIVGEPKQVDHAALPDLTATSANGDPVPLSAAQFLELLIAGQPKRDLQLPGPVDAIAIGPSDTLISRGGKIERWRDRSWIPLELPELGRAISMSFSSTGTLWVIDTTGDRTDVKEYSLDGKFLRHLGIAPEAPQPVQIVSAQNGRMLYLREENEKESRVRALALVGSRAEEGPGAEEISTWEVVFSQSIRPAATPEAAGDLLSGFTAEPTVEVALRENALQPERTGEKAALSLLQNDDHTALALADGLPLQSIATTPGLKWSQLGHRGKGDTLTVVQSDGFVIEEFTVYRPGNLASFDAGEYRYPKELPAPKDEQNIPEPRSVDVPSATSSDQIDEADEDVRAP